ncbi:PhnE/PtxC family ABC transporter permease [Bosea vaviloviae]|uniref:ABC transporter permease n=1 Tax=Bosea vaviloviae TaxID=1526658 RepID=A0A0N1F8V1_9HYPH|nr:ABC transporter permease [Bosea vaviloviae]KPH83093.1 ABC transporter permease [Bosea vaviloviae]
MLARATVLPKFGYVSASGAFLLAALLGILVADIAVSALDPWAEMRRLLDGLIRPDLVSIELRSVVWTVAFAVLGVSLGATGGFLLALGFSRVRAIRVLSAFLRSVHELFWALLIIQFAGISPLTGILAIAIPYAGIFAKVFSEMIEEADLAAERVLPQGASIVSTFAYVRIPELAPQFWTYTLYRLECGMRSTLVLGFIGLPTIGFHLDSFFKQGHYPQAAALLFAFYLLIGTRRLWARPATLPLLIVVSLLVLPEAYSGGSILGNFLRFASQIVPAPLRGADLLALATWSNLTSWFSPILTRQIVPGIVQTLVLSQIALVATGLLALGLFPLICRRFAGPVGRPLGRVALVIVRSTPEYMLVYVLLQLLGPSMLPAIIALSLHNGGIIAYLMGRHADELIYRPDAPKGLNLYCYETVPRLYGQFLAYMLYRWEIIIRESAIFGILGVATLGYYIDGAISEIRLDVALVLILATAVLSMAVDKLSRVLRKRLRVEAMPTRLSEAPVGSGSDQARLACIR